MSGHELRLAGQALAIAGVALYATTLASVWLRGFLKKEPYSFSCEFIYLCDVALTVGWVIALTLILAGDFCR